jgi:hypothetical protein
MTGAVRMSAAVTAKPAQPAPSRSMPGCGRWCWYQGQRQRRLTQPLQCRDRPRKRLPRHGQYAIDVDQHRVNAPHAETMTAAGKSG